MLFLPFSQVELSLWDTAGQEDFDRLRLLTYPDSDVILLCYSVDTPESLLNISEKWAKEIEYHCPNVPLILVANKKVCILSFFVIVLYTLYLAY